MMRMKSTVVGRGQPRDQHKSFGLSGITEPSDERNGSGERLYLHLIKFRERIYEPFALNYGVPSPLFMTLRS